LRGGNEGVALLPPHPEMPINTGVPEENEGVRG